MTTGNNEALATLLPARRTRASWPVVKCVMVDGRRRWRVDGRPYFGREFLATEAQARARQWTMRLDRGSESAVRLSTAQKVDAVRALKLLAGTEGTLADAAREWVARHSTGQDAVAPSLAAWLAHRDAELAAGRVGNHHLKNGKWAVKKAVARWGEAKLAEVTAAAAQAWLDGLEVGPWARANLRTQLRAAWGWLAASGKVSGNPWAAARADVPDAAVTVLDADGVAMLLRHARPHPAAWRYCLLGLGAGLRPTEAERVTAADLVAPSSLHVRATKTRERYIALEEWLWRALSAEGEWPSDLTAGKWRKLWRLVRVRAGYGGAGRKVWPADVLRHSFASYWLAVHANRAALAEHLGNSVEVVARHYRRPVPREAGVEFFALLQREAATAPTP